MSYRNALIIVLATVLLTGCGGGKHDSIVGKWTKGTGWVEYLSDGTGILSETEDIPPDDGMLTVLGLSRQKLIEESRKTVSISWELLPDGRLKIVSANGGATVCSVDINENQMTLTGTDGEVSVLRRAEVK